MIGHLQVIWSYKEIKQYILKWCVDLYFEHSGGPFSIIVSDEEETILLEDLYVGDVFLAGGQSNMEFKVKEGLHGVFDCDGIVRYLHVPQYVYEKEGKLYPEEDRKNWQVLDAKSYLDLSAGAYYFCQNLHFVLMSLLFPA